MNHKPTPTELALYINEDEYGLPTMSQGSGETSNPVDAGPQFDQGGGADDNEEYEDVPTQVNRCSAATCAHNQSGHCGLEAVEINERGGCEQFEAGADGAGSGDDGGRYAEDETGVMGGGNTNNQTQNDDSQVQNDRHWETGKWDPSGGGY